ncbi:hypothetical protein EGD00_05510 [Pectobacterium carotovorum subsp. carotovorum]|nr:hypothetical protein EGD00_05510 [Pectobacterium carotovorum subsp. carotovorum]
MLLHSMRPTQGAQSPPPCEPRLPAKSCRYAVPSVCMTPFRAASDAFPTRHWLSRHPCRSLGVHVHRCIIFTPDNGKILDAPYYL